MLNDNPFSTDSRQQRLQSPTQIGKTLKVTALPTYLLVCTALLLIGAFFVWGFLGTVSDKAYYSGVVFPSEGTTDMAAHTRIRFCGLNALAGKRARKVSVGA